MLKYSVCSKSEKQSASGGREGRKRQKDFEKESGL